MRRVALLALTLTTTLAFTACSDDSRSRTDHDAGDGATEASTDGDAQPNVPDAGCCDVVDGAVPGDASDDSPGPEGGTGDPDAAPDGGHLDGTCAAPLALAEGANSGDTTHAASVLEPTCASASGSGPEVVFSHVAGADGRLDLTLDSPADLGVSVRRTCDATESELACHDAVVGGGELSIPVLEGETLFVVVDGFDAADLGPFVLAAAFAPAECGNGALEGGEGCDDENDDDGDGCSTSCRVEACAAPTPLVTSVAGDTTSGHDVMTTGCSGASGPEHVYRFEAPAAGSYAFTLTNDGDADLVLALRRDCEARPDELCVDHGFDGDSESVSTTLSSGEVVFVVVDGFGDGDAGPFTLQVTVE